MEVFQNLLKLSSRWVDQLYQSDESISINNTEIAQPLCTALQIGLVELLKSWNITPSAVVGHSSGEIAAAYTINAITMVQAWEIAYFRGLYASRDSAGNTGGAMLAVSASPSFVKPLLLEASQLSSDSIIAIGCLNSPNSVTVTGDSAPVYALATLLRRAGVFYKALPIQVAYHSSKMQSVSESYRLALSKRTFAGTPHGLSCGRSKTRMYSSVTGREIFSPELCTSNYWVTNLLSQVRFSDAVTELIKSINQGPALTGKSTNGSDLIMVEVGPHASLRRPINDTCQNNVPTIKVVYESVLRNSEPARQTALTVAGRLYCLGVKINFSAVHESQARNNSCRSLANLPEYPFNHEKRYWLESRLSSCHRFRPFPRHDFLGTPTSDWNPLQPRWRNIIRFRENPWIADHRLKEVTNGIKTSNIPEHKTQLYPFGGMLAMVIEACRQLVDVSRSVNGFRIRNVRIPKALNVAMDAIGTETELYMRSLRTVSTKDTQPFDFRLCALAGEEWLEVLNGSVLIEFAKEEVEVDHGKECALQTIAYKAQFDTIRSRCKKSTRANAYYEAIKSLGFDFGPSFQTLDKIEYNEDGAVVARIDFSRGYQVSSGFAPSPHLVHPCSLDAMFQLTLAAISHGGTVDIPFMVPTQLGEMWISNKLLHTPVTRELQAYAQVTLNGFREVDCDFVALDPESGEELLTGNHYKATALRSLHAPKEDSIKPQLAYLIEWKPAIETMNDDELQASLSATGVPAYVRELPYQTLEHYCRIRIVEALKAIPSGIASNSQTHLSRYYEWLKTISMSGTDCHAKSSIEFGEAYSGSNQDCSCADAFDRMFNDIPEWRIYSTIGQSLTQILQGKVDGLDLLFRDGAAGAFYTGEMMNTYYDSLAALIDLMAFKNPTMNILEIGAGTGSATSVVFSKLFPKSNSAATAPSFNGYWYTDISSAFFEAAKDRYGDQSGRIHYKTLDVEQDPTEQGFEAEQFDVVIASCVIHATSSVERTLKNLARLLKPDGRIAILEPTNPKSLLINFCFALLPGWWLSEEQERREGPLLEDASWDIKLQQAGFEGGGSPVHHHYKHGRLDFSLITSVKARSHSEGSPFFKIGILVDFESEYQRELGISLRHEFQKQTRHRIMCSTSRLLSEVPSDASLVVVLRDCELTPNSLLDPIRWQLLKSLLSDHSSRPCVWISRAKDSSLHGPIADTLTGLGRSLRSENNNDLFRTIILEENSMPCIMGSKIAKVAIDCLDSSFKIDSEYRSCDHLLLTNRIAEATTLNDFMGNKQNSWQLQSGNLQVNSKRQLALKISSPGLLDSFYFEEEAGLSDEIPMNMIDVEVKAFGLNFKDVLIALGQVPESSLGLECAGRVTKIGKDVVDVKVGDDIFCCSSGVFKNKVRVHQEEVYPVPEGLSYVEAAAIPLVFTTAYYALHDVARLRKGESILIHSGAGGVGQAAVQLAQKVGAEIFVTVGSDSKKELMMSQYNISEDHILFSRNASFALGIQRMTGKGVDVILNSLSGELLEASWTCLAPFGRFIEIGKKDILNDRRLPMAPFSKNVSFASVDLSMMFTHAKALQGRLLKDVGALLWERPAAIRVARPLHVFKPSEIEEAFRFLQNGKNTGKTVIDLNSDSTVSVSRLCSTSVQNNS